MVVAISPVATGQSPKGVPMPPTDAAIHEFCGPIRRMVQTERRQVGFKAATARVARWCGLSERRVRAVEHGEVKAVLLHEMRSVEAAYVRWCRQQEVRLDAELAQLRADLQRMNGS